MPKEEKAAAKKTLIEDNKDDEKRESFIQGPYNKYQALKAETGGRAPTDTNRSVRSERSASYNAQEAAGIFWPVELWPKHHGGCPAPPELVKEVPLPNGTRKGIVLEDDGAPLPIGVIRLFKEQSAKTTEQKYLASTSLGDDQDTVKAIAQRVASRIQGVRARATATKTEDGSLKANEESEEDAKAKTPRKPNAKKRKLDKQSSDASSVDLHGDHAIAGTSNTSRKSEATTPRKTHPKAKATLSKAASSSHLDVASNSAGDHGSQVANLPGASSNIVAIPAGTASRTKRKGPSGQPSWRDRAAALRVT